MRVTLVSMYEPTPENSGGPSSLPFWLLNCAPEDIQFDICFLTPGDPALAAGRVRSLLDERRLRHLCVAQPEARWRERLRQLASLGSGLPVGFAAKRPDKDLSAIVQGWQPDCLWVYPNYWAHWLKLISAPISVVTGPDSESLWRGRAVSEAGTWKSRLQLRLAEGLDRRVSEAADFYHVVGREDEAQLRRLTQRSDEGIFFTPHPHPPYRASVRLREERRPVRVLVSGGTAGYQAVYLGDHLRRAIGSILERRDDLCGQIEFQFVGRGYAFEMEQLRAAGFAAQHCDWVEDYLDVLSSVDVQLCPLAVGSGTKGKVLQAIVSGVLVIGSEIAFENIAGGNGRSYLQYREPSEVGAMLCKLIAQPKAAWEIAEQGARLIASEHAPERCAEMFWNHIRAIRAGSAGSASGGRNGQ